MENVKQHWVPQSYLSAWGDPEAPGKKKRPVWVFPKEGGEGRQEIPKNIFWEQEMYTIRATDGGRDLTLENGLSGLEDSFAQLRRDKLEAGVPLDPADVLTLCAFTAAMASRSQVYRDHQRSQWGGMLSMMNEMHAAMMQKTPEERDQIARLSAPLNPGPSLGRGEVSTLAREPLQQMMVPAIQGKIDMLMGMKLAILSTNDEVGFISSDAPCVIYDPEALSRPFPYNVPGLIYPKVEVSLPISPRQMVVFNRQGLAGYMVTVPRIVDELNRRTRAHAGEEFVACRNQTKPVWYDMGTPPAGHEGRRSGG